MKRVIVRLLRIALPPAVIGVAVLVAYTWYSNRAPAPFQPPVFTPPGVRVTEIALRDVPLSVTSQGTVRPRTESQLVSEIAGRVTGVAPSFAEGGFFEMGDVLVTIDPFDYQQAVVSARSQLAQARLRLAQEEAEADVAVREWDALGRGDPRALTLRKPQLEDARSSVAGAEAGLERAQRDLERAEIVAPYPGRVRQKSVDIGQFIRVGDAVATIYAVDVAEVRLPLPDEQLAYLDLPLSYRGGADQPAPRVTLRATFAGGTHEWQGRIVRTEGEIDPVSRMVHAVAEVLDPYAPGSRPPLSVGMYVEAEIAGRTARNVAVVPRAALRGSDRVLVVDADDRLSFREIDILRATTDAIYVRGGLADGDLVVVSPLDSPTEGMRVQLADADADLLAGRRGAAPTVTDGMPGRALEGDARMTRAATADATALPVSDAFAPAAGTDRGPEATAPAADVDIDPSLSGSEQIAAIRGRLAARRGPPAAPVTRTTPNAAPVAELAPAPPAADVDIDPSLSGDEQIAAIRRRLAALRGPPAAPPARTTPPVTELATAPAATDSDIDPSRISDEQIAAIRRRLAVLRGTPAAPPTRTPPAAGPGTDRATAPDAAPDRPAAAPSRAADAGAGAIAAEPGPAAGPAAGPTERGDTAYSVAMLPFVNVSRNPADDWISADMAAALRTALEHTGALGVVALTAADEGTALEAAGVHGAQWLVGGGYQRVGDRLRMTARVLEVAGGDLIRSVKVDGTVDALDTLATELVATVRAEVAGAGTTQRTTVGRPAAPVVAGANTLAVLSFHDFGPDREAVPTVDLRAAITDAVAARLAELPAVTVVWSDDGAAWVIDGGVQQVGGVVRVTARLIDVESGTVLTAVKVDGTLDNVAELQARVASALSESVREALSALDAAAGPGAEAEAAGAVGGRS